MTESNSGGATPSVPSMDWQDWVRGNLKRVGIGAAVVVVVAGSVLGYMTSMKNKEAQASQALSQAWATVEAGNMPLAANDLSRLVERYGGTSAADEGAILLNEIRLLNGETDVAVKALQEFVKKRRQRYHEASAYSLLGGGLENQGKLREAAAAYRRAAEAAELAFLKAQYLMDAGRTFAAAADTAEAKAAYGEVLSKFGELAQAAEARVRMAELGGVVPPPPKPSPAARSPQAS
jgi:predicted negative regulator of RcsB-dependent stress response